MRRIYAISDGCFQEDKKIDQTLVRLLNKEKPRILFLPMPLEIPEYPIASFNQFVNQFHKRYRDELGCQTDVILTRDNPLSKEVIREKVLSSDAVYVGPGHVPTMMDKMKQFGFDEVLKEAYEKGIMMAGMSAGAMCWFWPQLGFIKSRFYPHYQTYDCVPDGYAANDPSATLFIDERVGQFVKLHPTTNLYKLETIDGVQKRTIVTLYDCPNTNPGR